jgi:hypothetical protein
MWFKRFIIQDLVEDRRHQLLRAGGNGVPVEESLRFDHHPPQVFTLCILQSIDRLPDDALVDRP